MTNKQIVNVFLFMPNTVQSLSKNLTWSHAKRSNRCDSSSELEGGRPDGCSTEDAN